VTIGTIQASMVDLDKQLLALKQQVEDGKAAAQQLTAKHDKEKAELVSSMEAERQLEQKQMQQISIKNDEARPRVALMMNHSAAGCRFDSSQQRLLLAGR
jgi:peptidoglycan hydrolase CwlO-like protein